MRLSPNVRRSLHGNVMMACGSWDPLVICYWRRSVAMCRTGAPSSCWIEAWISTVPQYAPTGKNIWISFPGKLQFEFHKHPRPLSNIKSVGFSIFDNQVTRCRCLHRRLPPGVQHPPLQVHPRGVEGNVRCRVADVVTGMSRTDVFFWEQVGRSRWKLVVLFLMFFSFNLQKTLADC